MPEIYILHFSKPVWGHAQHYCGYTKTTSQERLQKHRSGYGSRLCKYANSHNIAYNISYIEQFETSKEARRREIQLKRKGDLRRYCRICNAIQKKETYQDQSV